MPSPSLPQPSAKAARSQPRALPAFDVRRSSRCVLRFVRHLDPALVERLWVNPDEVVAAADMLKDGDRCTVVRIDAPAQSPVETVNGLTFKRYNLKDAAHTAVHTFLRSRALWSWLNGRKLAAAGVPTPMPMACVEERTRALLRKRSYLLTAFVSGRNLLELVQSGDVSKATLIDLAVQFARVWQTLGRLRAGHGDMKATNFIVDPGGQLWLIDLDGLRIYRSAAWLRRERRADLARFMRNWSDRPEVAAVFRARIGTG